MVASGSSQPLLFSDSKQGSNVGRRGPRLGPLSPGLQCIWGSCCLAPVAQGDPAWEQAALAGRIAGAAQGILGSGCSCLP